MDLDWFRVRPGQRVRLDRWSPDHTRGLKGKEAGRKQMAANLECLTLEQGRLYAQDMVAQGFVADEAALMAHIGRLEALAAEPGDKALGWQLGIDQDILDDKVRRAEIINWMKRWIV